ncbi:hypothetical protein BGX38DRAFT_1140437 [Terfezia claveryi]|nr:hypothetical protein BGX38DRAFT_1140437 [Terfezia claveryi]
MTMLQPLIAVFTQSTCHHFSSCGGSIQDSIQVGAGGVAVGVGGVVAEVGVVGAGGVAVGVGGVVAEVGVVGAGGVAVGVGGVVAEVGVVGAGGVAVGVGGVKRTRDIWNGPGKLELQEEYARPLRGERVVPSVRTREMRARMESRIWRFCMVAR